jgi:hypothetical protein
MNSKEKKRERERGEISYLYANKGKKGTVECFIPTRGTYHDHWYHTLIRRKLN